MLRNYGLNLLSMVRVARARGVPVVLATLPTQPAVHSGFVRPQWPDPFRPHVETPWVRGLEGIGQEVDVAAALNLLEAGEAAAALARLDAVARTDHPMFPVWRAECLDSLRRAEEAWAERFEALRRVDPARECSVQNVVIRAVGRIAGARVVDVVEGMRASGEAMGDPLGEFLWQDGVHPSFEGYALMGEAVARGLAGWWSEGGLPPEPAEDDPDLAEALLLRAIAAASDPLGRGGDWLLDPHVVVREAGARAAASPLRPGGDTILARLWETANEPEVRTAVLWAMGRRASASSAAPILEGLSDADPGVRLAAVRAAGAARLKSALPELEARLPAGAASPPERAAALRALGQIGGRAAVEAILRACAAPPAEDDARDWDDTSFAAAAAFALGRTARPEAATTLVGLLDHPEPRVIENALWALALVARSGLRPMPGFPVPRTGGCRLPPEGASAPGREYPDRDGDAGAGWSRVTQAAARLVGHPWPPVHAAAVTLLGVLPGGAGRETLLQAPEGMLRGIDGDPYVAAMTRVVRPDDAAELARGFRGTSPGFLPLLALVDPAAARGLERSPTSPAHDPARLVARARAGAPDALTEIRAELEALADPEAGEIHSGLPHIGWYLETVGMCPAKSPRSSWSSPPHRPLAASRKGSAAARACLRWIHSHGWTRPPGKGG
ncbi:MAG: HEAT repeat domain-containing protein, partial [Planctomycetota bacterium]|nr:HEAT repeat domain-containing protein [Planctomycetota bacterium]